MTKIGSPPSDPPGTGPTGAPGDTVLVLRPYPVRVGQKIFIEAGPRRGDWQIIEVGERKIRLRCPISHREIDSDWFCYVVTEVKDILWPHQH